MASKILSLLAEFWFYGMVVAMPGVIVFRWRWSGFPLATLFGWFALSVWAFISFTAEQHSDFVGEGGFYNPPQWDEDVMPFMAFGWFFSGIYSFFLVMLKALGGGFSQD